MWSAECGTRSFGEIETHAMIMVAADMEKVYNELAP
jgi:hypothetical protein